MAYRTLLMPKEKGLSVYRESFFCQKRVTKYRLNEREKK